MRKIIGLIILYFYTSFAFGQTSIPFLKYNIEKYGDHIEFPVFYSATDSTSCKRINTYLQLEKLSLLKGKEQKHIFEGRMFRNLGFGLDSKVDILRNDSKILSMLFDEASCGITCYYWNSYYNFDVSKGKRIFLNDFFDSLNFQKFKKLAFEKQIKEFKKQIKKIDKSEQDRLLSDIELCLKDRYREYYIAVNETIGDFYLQDSILILDGVNCLHKNDRVEYGFDMTTEIHSKYFFHLLNDYGKAIFSSSVTSLKDVTMPNAPFHQIFSGTINNSYPFVMFLYPYLNYLTNKQEVKGKYAYLKYGVAIELKGTMKNNKILLTELNDNDEIVGYFELDFYENSLLGIWKNNEKTKVYDVKSKIME